MTGLISLLQDDDESKEWGNCIFPPYKALHTLRFRNDLFLVKSLSVKSSEF